MATKLFLRNTTANGIGSFNDMLSVAGSASSTSGVVNTAASGTQIQWTATAGGAVLEWISGRVPAGGFVMSGALSFSVQALESNIAANCGAQAILSRRTPLGIVTPIGGSPWSDGVEFTTTNAQYDWTATPTTTTFLEDDRIVARIYITNVGTMGGARTCTLNYDGADGGDRDSFVQITEDVNFKGEGDSAALSKLIQSAVQGVNAVNNTTLAFPSSVTAGNMLVVTQGHYSDVAAAITTPTDTLGHTYLPAISEQQSADAFVRFRTWYVPNCAGGSNTVTCDIDGTAGGQIRVVISEWQGAKVASPISATSSGGPTTSTAVSTGDATPVDANCLLYAAVLCGGWDPQFFTQEGTWEFLQQYSASDFTMAVNAQWKRQTSAIAEDADWTLSNSREWLSHVIAFSPPAAAFPPFPPRLFIPATLG